MQKEEKLYGINGILWTYIKLRSCINIEFTGMCPQYGHEKLTKKSKDSQKKAQRKPKESPKTAQRQPRDSPETAQRQPRDSPETATA